MSIKLNNIVKKFDDFRIDINTEIPKGQLVTLLGPSGCGKTTTIQLVSGIISPDSGRILINTNDVTDYPLWERDLGIVFQDYALFPNMNVYNNIAYGLKTRKTGSRDIKKRVDEMLGLVGLSGYGERSTASLSGGEKQRTALARALAPSPELLLLDEPLSALDARLRVRLRKEIRSIQKQLGLTTIYVTHDQDEALSISDTVMLMNNGKVEQTGSPEEIFNYPETLFSAEFLGESNLIRGKVNSVSEEKGIEVAASESDLVINTRFRKGIEKNDSVYIFIRPHNISVAEKTGKNDNILSAVSRGWEYAGKYYSMELETPWGNIKAELPDGLRTGLPADGERINLYLSPEKCWLIRNNG